MSLLRSSKRAFNRGISLIFGETYGENLENSIIENLYTLGKKVFYGGEDLSDTGIVDRLASIAPGKAFDRRRLHLCVQTYYLKPFIETGVGYYRFYNPYFLSRKVLSSSRIEPKFTGEYRRKIGTSGRIPIPPKMRDIAELNPVLVPNNVMPSHIMPTDEPGHLLLFPHDVWERYKAIAILTSNNAYNLYIKLSSENYTPRLDGSGIILSESQRKSAGIKRDKSVKFAGVGNQVEIWDTERFDKHIKDIDMRRACFELDLLTDRERVFKVLFSDN
jgi:DNA-binding transcriptional regulator/RsmH inhibitor MraZ